MRRLALVLALGAALCLLVPLGSSGAPAGLRPVAKWLGTWDTASGKLVFDDLERKRSECTACGNPYYWALEGHWTHPHFVIVDGGKRISIPEGTTKIWGSAEGKDFETFQGEWNLPKESPYDNDGGSALIYRDGNKIDTRAHSGGYWKACPYTAPPGPKCPHGNWGQGEKTKGLWYVNFRVHQDGSPDRHRVIDTSMSGAGALILKNKDAKVGEIINSHIYYTEVLPLEHIRLTFLPLRGTVRPGDRRETVELVATVGSSDDKDCPAGTRFGVSLRDGHGFSPDQITLHEFGEDPSCFRAGRRTQTWTSLDKHRVEVTIAPPKET